MKAGRSTRGESMFRRIVKNIYVTDKVPSSHSTRTASNVVERKEVNRSSVYCVVQNDYVARLRVDAFYKRRGAH